MTDEEFVKKYNLYPNEAAWTLPALRELYDPKGAHGEFTNAGMENIGDFDDDDLIDDMLAKYVWGDPEYYEGPKEGLKKEKYTPEFLKDLKELTGMNVGFPVDVTTDDDKNGPVFLPFGSMTASQALNALKRRYPGAIHIDDDFPEEDTIQVLDELQDVYKNHGYQQGTLDWLLDLPYRDENAGFESVVKNLTGGKSSKDFPAQFSRDLKRYLHADNGLPWEEVDNYNKERRSQEKQRSLPRLKKNSAQQEADDRQSRITNAVKESE